MVPCCLSMIRQMCRVAFGFSLGNLSLGKFSLLTRLFDRVLKAERQVTLS